MIGMHGLLPASRRSAREVWRLAAQTVLMATAMTLALGTSKVLHGKRLVPPRPELPPAVRLEGQLEAWLRENVNNQGCFSRQWLDFTVQMTLSNTGQDPLTVDPRSTSLTVDGRRFPVETATFTLRGKGAEGTQSSPTLPGGARGELYVRTSRLLPKSALESVREARLIIPLGRGAIRLAFPAIGELPVVVAR